MGSKAFVWQWCRLLSKMFWLISILLTTTKVWFERVYWSLNWLKVVAKLKLDVVCGYWYWGFIAWINWWLMTMIMMTILMRMIFCHNSCSCNILLILHIVIIKVFFIIVIGIVTVVYFFIQLFIKLILPFLISCCCSWSIFNAWGEIYF
jgi:hypothetical protein